MDETGRPLASGGRPEMAGIITDDALGGGAQEELVAPSAFVRGWPARRTGTGAGAGADRARAAPGFAGVRSADRAQSPWGRPEPRRSRRPPPPGRSGSGSG